MQWTDEGILLSLRPHGESSAVASVLTRLHGRHAGLIRGARGKTGRAALLVGNRLQLVWAGRLAEQLGVFTWEPLGEPLAAAGGLWLHDPLRLAGLSAACALAELCLPEGEPHRPVHDGLAAVILGLVDDDWPSLYVRWELGLLGELGFPLDLTACAATGTTEDLIFVSPRSGRAVGRVAGEPYRDRLLPLPAFLCRGGVGDRRAVLDGLALTGHFLECHVLAPHAKGLPPARSRLVDRLRA